MNILIDIKHPAQLNMFKKISSRLKDLKWNIIICYLDRGKLPKIIEKEYPNFNLIKVGSSKGTKWSIFWNGNVIRTFDFVSLLKKEKIDICVAASSAPLAFACRITSTPIIQFYDDPERKGINKINEILSNRIFFPPVLESSRKVGIFNCLKEWSYLSPTYFQPNEAVLKKYGVKPYEYVFVREVSNKSFNYFDQEQAIVNGLSTSLNKEIPFLLSLEDKSLKDKYPSNWKVLEEPLDDIHSLIFFSKLMISSGDSMAREGAMLGVPSVYCGIREMKANQLLIDKGILDHLPNQSAIAPINNYIAQPFDQSQQHRTREQLLSQWDDMNVFIESQINKYKKK